MQIYIFSLTSNLQKSSAKFENTMEAIDGIQKGVRDAVSRRSGVQSILPPGNFTFRKIIERGRKGKSIIPNWQIMLYQKLFCNKKFSIPEFTFIISILGTFKICQSTTIARHLRVKLPVICFFCGRNTSCLGKGNRKKSSRIPKSRRRKVCIRPDIVTYTPYIYNNMENMEKQKTRNCKKMMIFYLY